MNSKSDEKITNSAQGERRSPPILRLVPRGEHDRKPAGPVAQQVQPKRRPHWDNNDDDPGPSAA